jgi:hypothetical protein
MLDLVYLLATLAFFMAMLFYVRGCNRLGHRKGSEGGQQ